MKANLLNSPPLSERIRPSICSPSLSPLAPPNKKPPPPREGHFPPATTPAKEVERILSTSIIAYPAPRGASQALALIDAHRLYRDAYGWATLPTRDDKSPDAALLPLIKGRPSWNALKKASDEQTLAWKDAYGLGVITGIVSGHIVVDLDLGADESLGPDYPLPVTVMARTPSGGWHLYYRHPGTPVATKAAILPHVDIRADGGYAVAAPTPGYNWVEGYGPGDIPMAECPAWVIERAKRPKMVSKRELSDILAISSPLVLLGPTQGADLLARSNDPTFVRAAARMLGIPNVPFGEAFTCVVPGHTDRRPSATLWRNPDTGEFRYHDWHGKNGGRQWLTLAQVRAAQAYQGGLQNKQSKQTRDLLEKGLSRSQFVLWTLRLMVETGYVQPARVAMPPLTAKVAAANADATRMYNAFKLLFGVRWLHTPGAPAPAAWSFMKAWAGIPENRAGAAIQTLREARIIRYAGTYSKGQTEESDLSKEDGHRRTMALFLPGHDFKSLEDT